jgi:imidazolonepropionase-like amidohydrolase
MVSARIEARRLIPGRGDVIEDGVVILDDGAIAYAGRAAGALPPEEEAGTVTVDTVMPGLWECHGHFFGTYTANTAEIHTLRPNLERCV